VASSGNSGGKVAVIFCYTSDPQSSKINKKKHFWSKKKFLGVKSLVSIFRLLGLMNYHPDV